MKKKTKGKIGSSFDRFLREEGLYEEAEATVIKRSLVWQIDKEMSAQDITKGRNGTPDADEPEPARSAARSRER